MTDRPDPEPVDPFTRGALSSRVVSHLSGATSRQLGYWHSTALLEATVTPGRRGVRRLYSWVDYTKVRAAVKLLDMGLPNLHLRTNILWLEQHLPTWYEIPLIAFAGSVIVNASGAPAYTAGEIRQRVAVSLLEAQRLDQAPIETDELVAVLESIRSEGPLGVLTQYGDVVHMDPRIRGGAPVIRGSRIETHFLVALRDRALDTVAIADRLALGTDQVERALEFEMAIAA